MIEYVDCNGTKINNGDILKLANYEKSDSQFAPKEPFLIFINNNDETELYISGMDEYHTITDYQTEDDKKENKISGVELFAKKDVIDANYTQKQPFDVCLTFDEIIKLHDIVREHLIKRDYGFVPAMHIVCIPDEEFTEHLKIKTCCIHDITKAYNKAKETKTKIIDPHIDITDEMKAEMI